jgi:hypothetical protein
MRALILACSVLVSAFVAVPAECQEDTSSSQPTNQNAVEGTVVSSTRNTLVVRTTTTNTSYSHTTVVQ